MSNNIIILGVDPGTDFTGWGVIKVEGKKPRYVAMGTLSLKGKGDHFDRMKRLFSEVTKLISQYRPTHFAIEAQFFGKNIQSMLKLGRAQGVAIAAALAADLDVEEFNPRRVKQAVTGRGGASKEQVASMVFSILKIKEEISSFDATDGLAIALTKFYTLSGLDMSSLDRGKKGGGWESFIKNNPSRVK